MVDISIVIVNYNVQFFIEQCLNSIYNLSNFKGSYEVIVIDNASIDGSNQMIESKYPDVILIKNERNLGFAVANNMGFKVAKGKYVLMLNPDTILEENTLQLCFNKMEEDANIGALGVRMVDGGGKFLPESKRGFPSPVVSFYRFTGLYRLFPKSNKFNAYYAGQLDECKEGEVDILCGAFMFMRKDILFGIGLLDESFFMYGEDIDLSYRFKLQGSKVLYYPESSIIHFKGESTKKNSIQYNRRFYEAMNIFARKHFSGTKASAYTNGLSFVIGIKRFLHFLQNLSRRFLLPIVDILLIFGSLFLVSNLWANFYFNDAQYYEKAPLVFNFGLYVFIWIVSLFYAGAYDQDFKYAKIVRNTFIATILILAVYGLLDTEYRSSRAVILMSAPLVLMSVFLSRYINGIIFNKRNRIISSKGINLLVLASEKEAVRIKNVLAKSRQKFDLIKSVPKDISAYELSELIKLHKIDEVICNVKEVRMNRVIALMSELGSKVDFKITGDESLGIIGSQSKNANGEIYTIAINYKIQEKSKIRSKRTFDLIAGLLVFLISPFLLLRGKQVRLWKIFIGKLSLVGYNNLEYEEQVLPYLKPGMIPISSTNTSTVEKAIDNVEYAKNYSVWHDLNRVFDYIKSKE